MTKQETAKKIIHIDMDAFYAAVEQRDNPELRNKPVIISGPPDSRSVVSTCSYEARKFGIHSAMPSSKAYRLCPQGIFIPPDIKKYRTVSQQIREIFFSHTRLVEPLSFDEAYLDVTDSECPKGSATLLAKIIKQEIFSKTALTASAGISYNKFLAKVASDWEKPDGLTTIPPESAIDFISELPIRKFFGIGKQTEKRMKELGILKGSDLYSKPLYELLRDFGKSGHYYYNVVRGIDDREVQPYRERKSFGRETTFDRDLIDKNEINKHIKQLIHAVLKESERIDSKGKTITLKVKYCNFQSASRSLSLQNYITEPEELFRIIMKLADKTEIYRTPVRLLGISFSQLDTDSKNELQQELPF